MTTTPLQSPEEQPIVEIEEFPSLKTRIQSTFIDYMFVLTLTGFTSIIINNIDGTPDWLRGVLFVSFFILYEPVCMTLGSTFGNNFMSIKVRKVNNYEQKINFIQAFFRFLLKATLGWISFFTIHGSNQRRAIHDIITATVVLKA